MSIDLWITIILGSAGLISGYVKVNWDRIMSRIDKLEDEMKTKISEQEFKDRLSDKLSPIVEDVQEIRADVKELLHHIINKR